MSQTSRSRILAAQRHRMGLARVIADNEMGHRVVCGACRGARVVSVACECATAAFEVPGIGVVRGQQHGERCAARCPNCGGTGSGRAAFARAIADVGGHFDVHRAREYAKTLVHAAEENDELSEALEGQPSECKRCDGTRLTGRHNTLSPGLPVSCTDCHGTGHNLTGVLPPIEVTPQDVRWAWDAEHVRGLKTIRLRSTHPLDAVQQAIIDDNPVVRTRVVPRGEHITDFCLDFAPWPGSNAGDLDSYAWRCAPKWLRGRLTHAQQRRERVERERGRGAARRVASSNAAQHAG